MDELLQLEDPILRRVLDVWSAARNGRTVPERGAIDPVELGRALAHVWLCEREAASGRFRYRLAGERINEVYRRSLAGLYLDEIIPEPGIAVVQRRYSDVVDTPAAVRTAGLVYLRNERVFQGERVILPLVETEAKSDLVLGATVYTMTSDRVERPPEQLTTVVRLRPLASERGWLENGAGERTRTLV